jgi:hypothetical protein
MAQAAEADDWQPVAAAAPADDWEPVGGAQQPASPGFFQSIKDHVEPVMNAMGQGFREGWGPDRWGMSEENVKWLSKVGIYAPEGATSYSNPFQAMNELLGETIARTGEAFSRGLPAAYRAAQSAAVEAGVNRDIASIPDAFMGSPHPTGRPGVAVAERTRATSVADLTGELARGRVPVEMTLGDQTRLVMLPDGHPIIEFRRDAAEIEKSLPAPDDGFTRLWRGNRPGEVGQNPQFTNSLDGIALPFRKAYGGDLSFVDVPTGDLAKYEAKAGAATGAEFQLPAEMAAQAQAVPYAGFPLSEARSLGVIGPEPPRMSEANPREAAAAATRSPTTSCAGRSRGRTRRDRQPMARPLRAFRRQAGNVRGRENADPRGRDHER